MQTTHSPLPPITISVSDHIRLRRLATQAEADAHPVAAFLNEELSRASIMADADMPPQTVRPGQWVTHCIDAGWPAESRLLVFPEDYSVPALQVSVLSPLGAALLGLKAGDRMPYRSIVGLPRVATAESLEPPLNLVPFVRRKKAAKPTRPRPDDSGPPAA